MIDMRTTSVLAILVGLTTLIVGCGAPAPEQNTAAPTTGATAVLPTPTQAVAEAAPITESVESAEVAESAAVAPAEEAAGEGAETEAPADVAADVAPSANWEEGPITFKSPSLHGAMTASGEPFDKDAMSAAHKELPFGAEVTVTNLSNGKQVTVIVNDRLPAQVSAVIDLSPAAAEAIDMVDAGIVDGRIEW